MLLLLPNKKNAMDRWLVALLHSLVQVETNLELIESSRKALTDHYACSLVHEPQWHARQLPRANYICNSRSISHPLH